MDEAGIEVADLETAKTEASRAIRELRQEGGASDEWSGWRLDIVCPEGSLLYSIGLDVTLH
ncbi:MAG TPA: hypothetical protein VK434_13020 [Microvirga sp.]|nr:hypothetical protein [Microvirga sp.]